jgi:uncharacterized membrane protein
METILHEWGSLILRWTHIITGIAWIGSSFYFMHLDAALRETPEIEKGGQAWEVHGGGFYQVKKYLVAPSFLPEEIMWHKWESYMTWVSGFFLLLWVYYYQSSLFLIDPSVRALTPFLALVVGLGGLAVGWLVYDFMCKSPLGKDDTKLAAAGFVFIVFMALFFQLMFSPRGAFIHTGALMATIMTGNVFFVIMPNQRKVIAALKAGEAPDPALGKQAKQRSTHNNYVTLPVVFLMISNHYPLTYSSRFAFVVVGLILVAGALVRVFYNERHAGHGDKWWTWGVAAVCIALAIAISIPTSPAARASFGMSELPDRPVLANAPQAPDEVAAIVEGRCSMCHGADPSAYGLSMAPKGIYLDTPEAIAKNAEEIRVQAVLSRAMPPNNITEMEPEERETLGKWLATLKHG